MDLTAQTVDHVRATDVTTGDDVPATPCRDRKWRRAGIVSPQRRRIGCRLSVLRPDDEVPADRRPFVSLRAGGRDYDRGRRSVEVGRHEAVRSLTRGTAYGTHPGHPRAGDGRRVVKDVGLVGGNVNDRAGSQVFLPNVRVRRVDQVPGRLAP